MKKSIIYVTVFIFFSLANISAKEIKITADALEVDRVKNISIFTGNVYVQEREIEIWSEKLIVKYNNSEKEVKEIYVENKVKIIKQEITATGNKGYYYPDSEILELFDNVEVNEIDNYIKCDELLLDIKNSTSIMKSNSSQRVEALIITN